MSKQYYDIVAVSRYQIATNESVDKVFGECFPKGTRSIRSFDTYRNKLLVFNVEDKKIDPVVVKKFEKFLVSKDYTKLFSSIYLDKMSELDARFFTIRLYSKNLSDIKELVISKLEKAIGRKLNVYDNEIYYFHLTKAQLKSRKLVRLIDDLVTLPVIDIVICI